MLGGFTRELSSRPQLVPRVPRQSTPVKQTIQATVIPLTKIPVNQQVEAWKAQRANRTFTESFPSSAPPASMASSPSPTILASLTSHDYVNRLATLEYKMDQKISNLESRLKQALQECVDSTHTLHATTSKPMQLYDEIHGVEAKEAGLIDVGTKVLLVYPMVPHDDRVFMKVRVLDPNGQINVHWALIQSHGVPNIGDYSLW